MTISPSAIGGILPTAEESRNGLRSWQPSTDGKAQTRVSSKVEDFVSLTLSENGTGLASQGWVKVPAVHIVINLLGYLPMLVSGAVPWSEVAPPLPPHRTPPVILIPAIQPASGDFLPIERFSD